MIASGVNDCYTKFIAFIEDFSDIIFICGLIGISVWNLLRIFVFGSLITPDIICQNKFINIVVICYMVLIAYLIYLNMSKGDPKHEFVVKYFGFIDTSIGKVFFLLFSAMLVFPFDGKCN